MAVVALVAACGVEVVTLDTVLVTAGVVTKENAVVVAVDEAAVVVVVAGIAPNEKPPNAGVAAGAV